MIENQIKIKFIYVIEVARLYFVMSVRSFKVAHSGELIFSKCEISRAAI